jgi:hypothetical protein
MMQERGFPVLRMNPLLAVAALCLFAAASAHAQAPRAFPFRATNYNVQAVLQTDSQILAALAKVDFVAGQVSRTLLVELHPDLHVNSVKAANGQSLSFERDSNSPMYLSVGLPDTVTPGKMVTLTFDYSGPVSNEEDSPTKGLRFASIDKTSAYLLLPARWFPLTDYPSNRYTGTFKLIVPDSFAVAGTGKPDAPAMIPPIARGTQGQVSYVFHCDRPAPVGSFVAGKLQLTPVQAEGYNFSVYAPPEQTATANAYATSLARILSYFTDTFGPFEIQPDLAIAQIPDGTLPGFSAPGILLISARQWTTRKANDRILAQLAAGQWWGDRVLPASSSDVWVTDGLSRYAEAMYAEQSGGVADLHGALEDFAVGALMYEEGTPIAQASRLAAYSDQYRSIVIDKGAMVFHMLRASLGDDAFTSLLKETYRDYAGKTLTIDDFQKLAATKAPPPAKGAPPLNLVAFFSQWLNSTGVPEFRLEYIVYRTPKGFKVVGKIKQDLDTFRMPVDVRVDTEGNPETKRILVSGTSSGFEIDTFGRPKPNGITIDPNNNLLKSSPRLRVHAAVARGEGLAANGKYFEAISEYKHALELQPNNSLADFRMAEAMFYQKNYQAAANAFRAALNGDLDPKWVNVWSHIYIGKIYDVLSQRERALNEYQLAQHTNDDTAGAQAEADRYLKRPYGADNATAAAAPSSAAPAAAPAPTSAPADDKPVLKKR